MKLEVGYCTHPGRVRRGNEDTLGVFPGEGGLLRRPTMPLFVVADGMGGYEGGEVASRLAVETMVQVFQALDTSDERAGALEQAVRAANQALIDFAAASNVQRMGTTIVAATVTARVVYFANVGDSRGYSVTRSEIRQVTQDHSLVAEKVRAGVLSADQAAMLEQRSVLTRSLGRQAEIQVDTFALYWQPGDAVLLCSDGLWSTVSEAQMLAVAQEMPAQAAADRLIEMSLMTKAPDNVSVIVVRRTT